MFVWYTLISKKEERSLMNALLPAADRVALAKGGRSLVMCTIRCTVFTTTIVYL